LDVSPRELTDWFWVAYTDAYDWVVEPNVLGMGTYSLGDLFVTKPYVSGAAYINKMSDYCGSCGFSPKSDCPITSLYWDFLGRNAKRLDGNPRVAMPLRSLEKRSREKRSHDRAVRKWVQSTLREGARLRPEDSP
jgi:deoxyribodipyrimidine photolyase-related protein